MGNHEIVPLTPDLARQFYGQPQRLTVRGSALLRDGAPIVVWGVIRDQHRWVLFSDTAPGVRSTEFWARRLIVRIARNLRALLASLGAPVHAVPQDDVLGACNMLEHLGFKQLPQGGVYEWRA